MDFGVFGGVTSAARARARAGRVTVLGAMLWSLSACGGGAGPGQPLHRFPSRDSLREIAGRQSAALPGEKVVRVGSWTMASSDAAPPGSSEWPRLLHEVAARRRDVTLSAELGCAAREIARFYDEHRAYPDERLRSFLVGRCGAALPSPLLGAWVFEDVGELPDAELIRRWGAKIQAEIARALPAGRVEAALDVFRKDARATVALVAGPQLIELAPRPPVADESGSFAVEGSLLTPADAVYALINQGAYGYRECAADPGLRLPRFRVHCQLASGDASAWLDVVVTPPGRLLTRNVVRLLVRAGADAALEYQVQSGAPSPVANAADFKVKLLAALNQTRAQAGAPPLGAAERQAAMSEKLAPHFFAASIGSDGELADNIALGLLAGWDVGGGVIRNGDFYSDFLGGTGDASEWLSALLEHPQARRALLNPSSRRIAIGALVDPRGLGALLTTYEFFERKDHRAEEEYLWSRIAAERARRGLAPALVVPAGSELRTALSAIRKGSAPDSAFQRAVTDAARRRGSSVGGWYLETHDLAHAPLPEELWRAAAPELSIAITHYQAPGGAWGQYVVLILNLASADLTAATEPPLTARRAAVYH